MIARFRVLLPFAFSVRQGDDLKPCEFVLGDYRVRIHPPSQATIDPADTEAVSPVPLCNALEGLRPLDPQNTTDSILMDGVPTIQANLLQIDFLKAEFDRRQLGAPPPEGLEALGDPPVRLVFSIANNFLASIRTLTRGSQVKILSPYSTFWRLDYLTDNEEELPPQPGLFQRRFAASVSWRVTGLDSTIWAKVRALPLDFTPPIWDTLLLDAEALLPDVGASIVLAYAGLETFIAWCLDQLAPLAHVPPDIWRWINVRERHEKEPSVTEQYDQLLRIFTNKSLKDENQLWEAYKNLRDARHSFVHEGKPVVGGEVVTAELAAKIVGQAKAIVDWVELLLPDALRRPKLNRLVVFTLQKMRVAPGAPPRSP